MSVILRVFLFLGAFATAFYIIYKVRKEKVKIESAIYWIGFSVLIFLLGVFPSVSYWMADLLKIQAPSNFVFLAIIFLLLVKLFSNSIKMSHLEFKFDRLAQNMAISEKRLREMEEALSAAKEKKGEPKQNPPEE